MGLFHVWLNRCNCVSCSAVFPPVLSGSRCPSRDANVKGAVEPSVVRRKNGITADSCRLSSAFVLIIFHKTGDGYYPKTSLKCHSVLVKWLEMNKH